MADMKKIKVDVVAPCYNEQECVPLFYGAVSGVFASLGGYDFTVTYVDDGSTDGTLGAIKRLAEEHGPSKVKYISFSRNFGKEAAIYAGLKSAKGDLVVLMDADLQHPPSLIPEMLAAIESGYDSCAAYRGNRKGEAPFRSFLAGRFYGLLNSMSSVEMMPSATDFRMMTRKMLDAVLSLGETERFTKGLFQWVGFTTKWIEFPNVPRAAGRTKFSFFALFKYAVNGFVAFSTVPLRLASVIGAFTVAAAFAYMIYEFVKAAFFGVKTAGFATTVILILFLGGMIIVLLGIIGEYLARIYQEIKKRPVYVARETNAEDDGNY